MPRQPNHYRILDVGLSADHAEIQHAYREMAKRYHPDRVPVERRAWARTQMACINAAYAVLGDPARRAAYDQRQGYLCPGDVEPAHSAAARGDSAPVGQPARRSPMRRGPTRREGQRRARMSKQRVRLLGSVVALGILLLGALYWWRVLAPGAPQHRWGWAALLASGLALVLIVERRGRR
jgi:curved DNA-binding protein CbpA